MDVRADGGKFYEVDADALVVAVFEGESASDGVLHEIDEKTGGIVSDLIGSDELKGKFGDTVYLYRIAGILVADRRDEGAHLGRSLALAYVGALREAFLKELAVGEQIQTPVGTGEVRYVSEDGQNAAVKLDGGSRREVWLPIEVLSRLSPTDDYGLRAS